MAVVTRALPIRDTQLSRYGNVAYAGRMSIHTEDSALMLRYKDGDIAAFETLYRRHKDSLYRYLLRLSQNRDAAEDVFQEVWSKIIKSRENYRPTAKFSTFLFRVAHNCFIDYIRRNKRHTHNSAIDPDSRPNPGDEPELTTEKEFARRRMIIALRTLPEDQRDVFLLYEEAGLSIDAIATATGVNRETTKSRLRYAVNKLKLALIEPENNDDGYA